MTSSMTIAVDLAKTVFEIAVADSHWRIVERRRLSRSQFQQFFFNREPATVCCATTAANKGYYLRSRQKPGLRL